MEPLKLAVFDIEDLAVVSAHVQDAVLRVGDVAYLPAERRFALVVQRVEAATGARQLAGLHFERVLAARTRGFDRSAPDAALTLLAVTFEPAEAPSGRLTLHFQGAPTVQLDVECIEALMSDLAPAGDPAQAGPA